VKRLVVCIGAAAVVALLAAPASAHIAIDPSSAPRGAEAVTLAFNVPNEKDNATTNKVEIVMPEDHPLSLVAAEPVPGWTISTQTKKLDTPIKGEGGDITDVVSRVIYSGGTIGEGQFQQFLLRVGPLPDSGNELEFKALQTYSDGTTVRWIESTPPGGAEPENPAPTLTLTAAADDHGGTTASTTAASSGDNASASTSSSNNGASGRSWAALIIGIAGMALAIGAIVYVLRGPGSKAKTAPGA